MNQIEQLIEDARLQKAETEARDHAAYLVSLQEIRDGKHDSQAILAIAQRFGKELTQIQADLQQLDTREEQYAHIVKWNEVQPRLAEIDSQYVAKVAAFKILEDRHTEELYALQQEAEGLRSYRMAADSAGQMLQSTAGERSKANVAEVIAEQEELFNQVRDLDKRLDDKRTYRINRDEQERARLGISADVAEKQATQVWDAITADIEKLEAEKAAVIQEVHRYNNLTVQAREALWLPLAI